MTKAWWVGSVAVDCVASDGVGDVYERHSLARSNQGSEGISVVPVPTCY